MGSPVVASREGRFIAFSLGFFSLPLVVPPYAMHVGDGSCASRAWLKLWNCLLPRALALRATVHQSFIGVPQLRSPLKPHQLQE